MGVVFARVTQPCQPSPVPRPDRPAHRPFRGLLSVHSRCGLHTRTVTVCRDPLSEGFRHFVASMPAPVASGWSESPGGACTHWKAPPCHGAHPLRTLVVGVSSSAYCKLVLTSLQTGSEGSPLRHPKKSFRCEIVHTSLGRTGISLTKRSADERSRLVAGRKRDG